MASKNIEARLAALESEVARLGKRVGAQPPHQPWWERIAGAFANDPAFDEAMRLGRAYRESLRPRKRKPRRRNNGHP